MPRRRAAVLAAPPIMWSMSATARQTSPWASFVGASCAAETARSPRGAVAALAASAFAHSLEGRGHR